MSSPLKSKRSLPTLTEVVYPQVLQPPLEIDRELLIENLLQRVAPTVEQQLREMLQGQVHAQMRLLLPQLQQAMEIVVKQAVADAMAERNPLGT